MNRKVQEQEIERREVNIRKGMRQGGVLIPLIFNLYMEKAIGNIKDRADFEINIQGQTINVLKFMYDIAILASSTEKLEMTLNEIITILTED